MTKEEKAKAYDKAIEKIMYVMQHGVSPVLNKEDLQDIFPELKESKDERIRNQIINFIEEYGNPIHCEWQKDWIAWLKKQAPKPKWSDDDEQYLLVCKNALRKYQVSDKWDAEIISKWLEDKLKH